MKPFPLEDEVGDIIQKARQGWNYSLATLASHSGLSVDDLVRIENYQLKPSNQQLAILAPLLHLNPSKLRKICHGEWSLPPLTAPGLSCLFGDLGEANSYILELPDTKTGIIIDPGINEKRLQRHLDSTELKILACLVTHSHDDHIGSLGVLHKYGDPPVFGGDSRFIQPEQDLTLGSVTLQVIDTPGHSRDSKSFRVGSIVFVGDLLFAGSLGRTNQPGAYRDHLEVARQILDLPHDTLICPGHGPMTTVLQELTANPFF